MKAIIGMGANLGSPVKTLKEALECIVRLPGVRLVRTSSFYDTAPVETPDEQPDYVNCVAELETERTPQMLLGMLLGIESAFFRERPFDKAARTLDIDLLICAENGEIIKSDMPELRIPHPRMTERGFVLVPLAELFPDFSVFGMDFSKNFERCKSQRVNKLTAESE